MVFLVHPVNAHFFDSGAFSLHGKELSEQAYRTYMDRYATFVKANCDAIDYYANVDVIGDPKRSWEHLQYLEGEYNLHPVPVIHQGTAMHWVAKHIEAGYTYIGLSGIQNNRDFRNWLDSAFSVICATQDRRPCVKTHGFGVGGFPFIARYPWYSVDTVRWVHLGSRAELLVPRYRNGNFCFDDSPYLFLCGNKRRQWKEPHVADLGLGQLAVVKAWLEHIGLNFDGFTENPTNWYIAYLRYYETLRTALPQFPWKFVKAVARKLGDDSCYQWSSQTFAAETIRIYYSGHGQEGVQPEIILGSAANIMLSFFDQPSERFQRVLAARQTGMPVSYEPPSKEKQRGRQKRRRGVDITR